MRLEGTALHGGGHTAIELRLVDGPLVFAQRGAEAPLEALHPERTDRGVALRSEDGRVGFDLAEHLLAALGGLGVRRGVRVEIDGDEIPLLDGGACRFVEALRAIGAPCAEPPRLVVARVGVIAIGASIYRFEPGPHIRVEVGVVFRPPVGAEEAVWSGEAEDFAARIAPARTFGWLDEREALAASGRARGVDLASVVVFDGTGVVPGCRPFEPGEAARHKLLDLVGDLALYGGPPMGAVRVERPGHAATHAAVAEAFRDGVLVRTAGSGSAKRSTS